VPIMGIATALATVWTSVTPVGSAPPAARPIMVTCALRIQQPAALHPHSIPPTGVYQTLTDRGTRHAGPGKPSAPV